jgi:hypothetical protein
VHLFGPEWGTPCCEYLSELGASSSAASVIVGVRYSKRSTRSTSESNNGRCQGGSITEDHQPLTVSA